MDSWCCTYDDQLVFLRFREGTVISPLRISNGRDKTNRMAYLPSCVILFVLTISLVFFHVVFLLSSDEHRHSRITSLRTSQNLSGCCTFRLNWNDIMYSFGRDELLCADLSCSYYGCMCVVLCAHIVPHSLLGRNGGYELVWRHDGLQRRV